MTHSWGTWSSKRNGASWDFFFQFQGKMAAAFQPKRKPSTHSRFSTKKNERKSTWGGDPPIGEDAIGKKKQVETFFALEQQCKTREKKIEKEKGVFKKNGLHISRKKKLRPSAGQRPGPEASRTAGQLANGTRQFNSIPPGPTPSPTPCPSHWPPHSSPPLPVVLLLQVGEADSHQELKT